MPNNADQNRSGLGEVVVQANLTRKDEEKDLEDDDATSEVIKEVRRLKSELDSLKNNVDCMIHGEFDAIKHYVDRALERDRLKKRP